MSENFRSFFYTASDGLRLHARLYGEAGSPGALPVVCLPGLTRNARDFHVLAGLLAGGGKRPRRVVAFDYRGRGLSARDPRWRNYTVSREAADIMDGLTVLGIERAAFIGTSRGGLIVMALAARRPALLSAAVLNDTGPAMEGEGLAHIRSYLENAPRPDRFEDAVALQKAVHGPAFAALSEADWERHTEALYRIGKDGELVADFDPKLVRTLKKINLSRPLPTHWPQFTVLAPIPVLAIRGANSKLVSPATLERMAERHPDLDTVTVEGQGHAPLLETGELPGRIGAFLARADRAAR